MRLIFVDQTGELSCVRVSSDLWLRPIFLRPGLTGIASDLLAETVLLVFLGSCIGCPLSSRSRSRSIHRCQRIEATSKGTATPSWCGITRAV